MTDRARPMERFLLAHSGKRNWLAAADDCLGQLPEFPPEASLGFVYATDALASDLGHLLRYLQAGTPVRDWVGTVGYGICATGTEYYDAPALVLLVTDLPRDHFRVFEDAAAAEAMAFSAAGIQFAVVHGDPRNPQVPRLVRELPGRLGNGYLCGGLSSSRGYHFQLANALCEGSLSGVLLDDGIPVFTGLTQGCTPIGPVRTITRCEGNLLLQLDGRPALDVLREDVGELLAHNLHRLGGYIFVGFPVHGTDTGDYLVRNLISLDVEQGIVGVGEHLEEGRTLMFCRRDAESAAADLRRMVRRLHERLPAPARGGLYFSCVGRGQHMFGEAGRELRYLGEELGDVPVAGFYANGEIAGDRLYGYTGVLALFT